MTPDEIHAKLQTILNATAGIDRESITPESTLNELGIDSLDEVEIVMACEDEFGIDITDEQVRKIRTVGDIGRCIARQFEPPTAPISLPPSKLAGLLE
jgi:acyl carrier protein